MKKLLLFLVLALAITQGSKAQCAFTHTVSGNTATFTPTPFVVIGTTVLDSLVYDYGDGTGTFNIPLSQTSNAHTYMMSGTYNACHTYYMHQLGNPNNSFTCNFCDSVTIGTSVPGCSTSLSLAGTASTITATATATGGMAPYTYSYTLNPGNITNTSGNFIGLTSGTYIVCATAIDAMQNVCSVACDSISIGNTFPCSTTIQSVAGTNSILASAAATGGTAPYTYSYNLNPGNVTNTTGIFTGLANGGYSICVIATDAQNNTCTIACDSAFVGTTTGPCSTTINTTTNGNTVTASGTAVGGTAPYTYSYTLNPGNITNATGVFTSVANGSYVVCVTATDAQNTICSIACDSVTVGNTTACATTIQTSLSGNTITATATATGPGPYAYSYTLNPGNITNATGIFPGLAPGLYIVCATAGTATNICSTDCDTVTINSAPGGCTVTAGFSESINGLTVNFSNSSTISNGTISNYAWSYGDGNISTVPSPQHSYTTANTYNVVLVVTGYDSLQVLCVDSFSKSITVSVPFSVNDVKVQELNIYPNPTAKNITIDLPLNEKFENLVITDVSGRVITTNYESMDSKKLVIGLKNQSSGIYFIKLLTDKHIYTSSIMKQE